MTNKVIENIKIVLVGTTHPGNIGATARAMKTMGISRLRLVLPRTFPSAEATARATGADDVLIASELYDSLEEAVKDCKLVIATSARNRNIEWPIFSPEQAAAKMIEQAQQDVKAALVFGRESSGLSNVELECCNAMLQIPTNPDFSSLNLASAVQIVCYELRKIVANEEKPDAAKVMDTVTVEQMNMLYEHLEETMIDLGYLDPENPRHLMRRLKRLFNRAQLDVNEYNILRGILTASQTQASKSK